MKLKMKIEMEISPPKNELWEMSAACVCMIPMQYNKLGCMI